MTNGDEKLGEIIFRKDNSKVYSCKKRYLIWTCIHRKSKSEVRRRNLFKKREKFLKRTKINLIYALKLKSNVIGQNIRGKHVIYYEIALELIQLISESRLFILHFEKWIFRVQAVNSYYSFDEIFILSTPLMQN